jgi:hypothetical protein
MNSHKNQNLHYLFEKYNEQDISTNDAYNFKTIPDILDKLADNVYCEDDYIHERLSSFKKAVKHITAILSIYNPERIPYELTLYEDDDKNEYDYYHSYEDDEENDIEDDDPINALMVECYRMINTIRILMEHYPADTLIQDCLNIGWEENHHDDPDDLTADEAIAELEYIIEEIRRKDKYAKDFIKNKLTPLYDYFDNPPMDLFK